MARIRTVKPGFFTSRSIAALPDDTTRLAFIGIWGYVDDHGRGVDDPRLVKAAVFPLDDRQTPRKVDAILATLAAHGKIVRYTVNGERYFEVSNWPAHQRVNRPTPSVLPSRHEQGAFTEDSVKPPAVDTEDSLGEGKGREGKGEPSVADGLLSEWFESRTPRPLVKAGQWVGMRSVVAKALGNGHPPERVRTALRSCDVVSTGWLEPALRKAQTAHGTSYKPEPTHFR